MQGGDREGLWRSERDGSVEDRTVDIIARENGEYGL
jgi:hypothetical protein